MFAESSAVTRPTFHLRARGGTGLTSAIYDEKRGAQVTAPVIYDPFRDIHASDTDVLGARLPVHGRLKLQ